MEIFVLVRVQRCSWKDQRLLARMLMPRGLFFYFNCASRHAHAMYMVCSTMYMYVVHACTFIEVFDVSRTSEKPASPLCACVLETGLDVARTKQKNNNNREKCWRMNNDFLIPGHTAAQTLNFQWFLSCLWFVFWNKCQKFQKAIRNINSQKEKIRILYR